jgi:hypothetical protein
MSNGRVIFIFTKRTNPFLNIDDHLTNNGCSLDDLSNIDMGSSSLSNNHEGNQCVQTYIQKGTENSLKSYFHFFFKLRVHLNRREEKREKEKE